jgi:hypothetical protein
LGLFRNGSSSPSWKRRESSQYGNSIETVYGPSPVPVAFLPVRKFFPNRINIFTLKKFVRSVLRKFADYLVIGVLQASILESSASPELNVFSKSNALMVNQPSAFFQNLFPVTVEC